MREEETGSWRAAHGATLAQRCRAPASRSWSSFGPFDPPLVWVLGHLSTWSSISVLCLLVIVNGRKYQLRDLSLLFLAWVTLIILTIRGVEALHVSRLASPDPEVRRRAIRYVLNEGEDPEDSSVQAAVKCLWDPDPRVVYEVLRAVGIPPIRTEHKGKLEEMANGADAAIAERASYLVGKLETLESVEEQICVP